MNYYDEIISRLVVSRETVDKATEVARSHKGRGIDDSQISRLIELRKEIDAEVNRFRDDAEHSA